ncbi:MAG: hypothetical protein A3K19_26935 [Lentisphaerae bacterium RIFOXYB12_FULL_65_16]|nr:MAG: hypothetical protein A3K18_23910 [Lentisphaerae bacterium RIFOXYA12_64_32]OGV88034.1 MAG: hypothetical protein A3K19_26935 [Lentisphaerae bacterium RIFOXYB12_FULL_65_16]
MNSKERVLRSIRHQDVDRVPCFYLGTGAVNTALAARLGIPPNGAESLLQRLGVDVRFVSPRLVQAPGESRYGFTCGNVHAALYDKPGKSDLAAEKFPLEEATTVDQIHAWRWPNPDWFDYRLPSELLPAHQDRAVVAYDMGIVFLYAMGVRGMVQIMLDMAGEPDMAHAVFAHIADFNLERTRRFLDANRGIIDAVGIGDDVAGQSGLFFSLDMWREFLKPHVQRMVDLCREFSVIPYFHGCGGFRDLFPDFIAMGVPCVGRLQTEARGNDFKEVKSLFGRDLCLWGGIDGQHVVIEQNPEHVRAHVRELLAVGSVGSGYIAGPTHSFTEDTPIDNVLAVYDALACESKG